jgi:DNA primase
MEKEKTHTIQYQNNNNDEDYYDMVKEEITTTKYLIHSHINAMGFVEKPDVVGAIFGQTEGLLSDSLDLRELQKTGRIGRIKVDMTNRSGRTKGEIIIPSSLDRIETTILAASLETINRVGPCEASLHVIKIEDVRAVKRKAIVERAKELYKNMMDEFTPESSRMIDEVKESIRIPEIIEFGDDKLPAGPNTPTSDAILIVEGRSDVLNLLKYGIKNTIAVEGVNVPNTVAELTKERTVTAFLDGDRGGDLILKELLQIGEIDYVTRAPRGQEVEYLNKDQVLYALKNKTSVDKISNHANYNHNQHHYHIKPKPHNNYKNQNKNNNNNYKNNNHNNNKNNQQNQEPVKNTKTNTLQDILKQIEGTNKGQLLDKQQNKIKEVKVENIYNEIKDSKTDINSIVFDGIISQRLIDLSKEKNIENIVAVQMGEIVKKPETIKIQIK